MTPRASRTPRHGCTGAATDLRAAALDLAATPPILEDVVFHCQQAVEKAMKGLLAWHDEPFGKTHDLEALGETCLRMDSTLKSLVDRAAPLTEYAWKFRYPGEDEQPTRDESERALAIAREAFEVIRTRLPEDVRP